MFGTFYPFPPNICKHNANELKFLEKLALIKFQFIQLPHFNSYLPKKKFFTNFGNLSVKFTPWRWRHNKNLIHLVGTFSHWLFGSSHQGMCQTSTLVSGYWKVGFLLLGLNWYAPLEMRLNEYPKTTQCPKGFPNIHSLLPMRKITGRSFRLAKYTMLKMAVFQYFRSFLLTPAKIEHTNVKNYKIPRWPSGDWE